MPRILSQILKPTHPALFATGLLDGFDPTELSQSGIPRLFRLHASLNILLRLHLDVRTHLVVHPRIELFLLEQSAESKPKFVEPVHRKKDLSCFEDRIDGRRKPFPI